MDQVTEYTDSKFIKFLESENKYDAIGELASLFKDTGICSDVDTLISALREREDIMSTGIGLGIAIPHAKIGTVSSMAFAVGISKKGIDFDSLDGEPVCLVILVAAGEKQHKKYLKLLSNIMSVLKDEAIRNNIINSGDSDEVLKILKKEIDAG